MGLRRYARDKNQPTAHATSKLSPYLHSGYISSLEIALQVREHAREHKLIADESWKSSSYAASWPSTMPGTPNAW